MSQPEFLPIVFPCQEAERLQREITDERWRCHLYNDGHTGTLCHDTMREMSRPEWQWGDYQI